MSKLSPDQWQALSPRLDEALEMTDEERSTWLSSPQAENPRWRRNWKSFFRSTASCLRKVFSKHIPWNCRESLAWQVKLLVPTLWFRKSDMGEWAPSGWRNETTDDLSGA